MKMPLILLGIALMVSFCFLPIMSDVVVLPYWVVILGGLQVLALNALLGGVGFLLVFIGNTIFIRHMVFLLLNIIGGILMVSSLLLFFMMDSSHATLQTFSYWGGWIFYILFVGIQFFFLKMNFSLASS